MVLLITSSCNIDDVITTTVPPQIAFEGSSRLYTVKVGRQIVITPQYTSVEDAQYCWSCDGETISQTPTLTFSHTQSGQYYITLTVTTPFGTAQEEIRIDVVDLETPTVTLTGSPTMTLVLGSYYLFNATVKQVSLPTTIAWTLNGQPVEGEYGYLFNASTLGKHTLTVTASNSDGKSSDTVEIEVLSADQMPFVWEFDSLEPHTVVGRKIAIIPTEMSDTENVSYYWLSNNQPQDASREPYYIYTPTSVGRHTIKATASTLRGDEPLVISHIFTVDVYPQDKYYTPATPSSSKSWHKVYQYTPAPGQFIGDQYTASTPTEACCVAEARMRDGLYLSLGGFGGFIVVGFDHSVSNKEGYDFAVAGNSFNSSSEPGIVWVMQDENGDRLPNDTWYELAGSETGKSETIQNYAVTYFRPSGAGMAVEWRDNYGNSGVIDYLPTYHKQDYYYPQWIASDSYTLRGTRLKERNYDKYGNGAMWIQPPYDWGYADNYSSIDRLSTAEGSEGKAMPNGFDISNAIDCMGEKIELHHIDFVKVQTACNTKSGWLGENSTEIFDIYSLE